MKSRLISFLKPALGISWPASISIMTHAELRHDRLVCFAESALRMAVMDLVEHEQTMKPDSCSRKAILSQLDFDLDQRAEVGCRSRLRMD